MTNIATQPIAQPIAQPVECTAAWKGPEITDSNRWIYRLTDSDIAEIDGAIAHVKSKGLHIHAVTKADFPLPQLAARLAAILQELETGLGCFLIRGIPVARLGNKDATLAYWGVGTHLGSVVAQNMMGELLGDVRVIDCDWDQNFNIRGYQTNVHLPFHCDKSDVVGLLCLQTSKSGGTSSFTSAVAIHNEILRTRPDLLETLYHPFCVDHRGEEFEGDEPYYVAPVYTFHKGKLYSRFGQRYVETGQRFPQVPRLTQDEIDAMNLYSKLALSKEFRLDMQFERGDIQLLNNHVTVHSRTDYEDFPEPERRRHLVRMLLFTPGLAEVPPHTAALNDYIRRWGAEPRESVLQASAAE
jgi:hypothetical protein